MAVTNNGGMVFCLRDGCTIRDQCLRVKPKGMTLFNRWVAFYKQEEDGTCNKFMDNTLYKLQ